MAEYKIESLGGGDNLPAPFTPMITSFSCSVFLSAQFFQELRNSVIHMVSSCGKFLSQFCAIKSFFRAPRRLEEAVN